MEFFSASSADFRGIDGEFADLLDGVSSAQFTGVFADVVTGVDDDREAGWVTRAALGVLLVVVHVDLVDATWSNALRPHHVLDGAARVGFDVRIDVEHSATGGFFRTAVDALS
ncbi:MAG: hypothetical protein CMB11_01130 [Euryarchaeota archaeon]|nr:hypothetical protein [Euryarchaeota archaeon]